MPRFANSFWSPDYISGIDKLSRQSVLSLGQLHELRTFVFSYMKYFHANGEYLSNLADSSYPIDSSFRNSRGPRVASRNISGMRQISRTAHHIDDPLDFDMDYVFRQFIERTRQDLLLHQKAASEIDQLVLERITIFLKHHEPQVKQNLADLSELFDEYKHSYQSVETIKQEYTTMARLGEFLIHKEINLGVNEESDLDPGLTDDSTTTNGNYSFNEDHRSRFRIPLVVAGVTLFPDQQTFSSFVCNLVSSVPITKRKIPLPGYRNEIFSSEQLCDAIKREKPRAFNPTRSNLEKLGQNLLDMKILVDTGFFAKKFNSEDMWFEWSDSAINMTANKTMGRTKELQLLYIPKFDETWSNMTSATTQKFSGVFKSMKNSLSKQRFSKVDLADTEEKYNEAYVALQKQKHLLEMKIVHAAQNQEQFEKLKVELVFQSLTKLLQILQATSSSFAADLDKFSQRFVSQLNAPENYLLEFNKGLDTFSTGVYFPSLLAPNQPQSRRLSTSQLNTNFQNIKLNFNLFKDIPLQAKLNDKHPELPLSIHSIPVFLYESFKSLEKFSQLELGSAWRLPMNYQQYWLMKDDLISELQEYESGSTDGTEGSELALLGVATTFLDGKDVLRQVNFVKNWLLEISDSIIPSTVHDSLIANYKITRKDDQDGQQRLAEMLRILGAMPRSNLSALIFVLEHVSTTFEIDPLSGFGDSDEIEETPPDTSAEKLEDLARALNSVEAIAAIPFLHLVMRPSIVKHASGYRPPLDDYNLLLKDLLSLGTRRKLFQVLVASEQHFLKRQEQQRQNLGIQKRAEPRDRSASVNSTLQNVPDFEVMGSLPEQSDENVSPGKNVNFELRSFRTGPKAKLSPSTSPEISRLRTNEGKHFTLISLAPHDVRLDED